ncbi:MAG: hypothetical protein HKN70_02830 [Gammaproteobacteria bacterium]|nr:hypothetical protein [Gammaproteobacteria bacterium]
MIQGHCKATGSLDSPGPAGMGPRWRVAQGPACAESRAHMGSIPATKKTVLKYGCICVVGWSGFVRRTVDTLNSLMTTGTGKDIVADIQATGKMVWITGITQRTLRRGKGRWVAAAWEHNPAEARSQDPLPHSNGPNPGKGAPGSPASWVPDKPGNGSSTTIEWDPGSGHKYTPNELIMGHELIHARRNARGYQLRGRDSLGQILEEVAVGGPANPTEPMTGNRLRQELSARPGAAKLRPKVIF